MTFVPYHLGQSAQQRKLEEIFEGAGGTGGAGRKSAPRRVAKVAKKEARVSAAVSEAPIVSPEEVPEGATPIGTVAYRQRARVAGKIKSLRVQPWAGVATLECVIVDGTGGINLVFLGRHVPGLAPGVRLVAEGTIGDHGGKLAILNPLYRIVPKPDREEH